MYSRSRPSRRNCRTYSLRWLRKLRILWQWQLRSTDIRLRLRHSLIGCLTKSYSTKSSKKNRTVICYWMSRKGFSRIWICRRISISVSSWPLRSWKIGSYSLRMIVMKILHKSRLMLLRRRSSLGRSHPWRINWGSKLILMMKPRGKLRNLMVRYPKSLTTAVIESRYFKGS